ncbi:MAG: HEAT repeat domain-containing protein [Planctomycetes bacterium]|nr:HEAT repeat domain-containing protein [Planctomycetota bacterium]
MSSPAAVAPALARRVLTGLLLAGTVATFAPAGWSHGANWRPPSDGTTNPGSAGAPTTGGRGPATGGRGARSVAPTLDRWEAWWYFQRESYLPRHTVGRMSTQTGAAGFLTGRGDAPDGDSSPLLQADARHRVLAALIPLLGDGSTEVVDAAAIALGRSVPTEMAGPFLAPLTRTLAHAERTPRQAAAIALGILGGPEAAELLREIAADTPRGRKVCDATGPIDDLLRGLAVLALGLTDQAGNIAPLVALAREPAGDREIAASAVLALGLHAGQAPHALTELQKLLGDDSLDREVRAQVPIALQRLPGGRALLPRFVVMLADKGTCNEVARSLAIALGALSRPEEAEALAELRRAGKEHSDSLTRHLAMLSLGRVFERAGALNEAGKTVRREVQEWLLAEVRDPTRGANRPFAALALGLAGRGDRLASSDGRVSAATQRTAALLDEELDATRDPSLQGALAIALALMDGAGCGPKLAGKLTAGGNPVLQGHLATACAIADATSAVPTLRKLLVDGSTHPAVRIDVARALGLLADRSLEPELIDAIAAVEDLPRAAAFAKALGLLGGKAAIDPLLELANREQLPEYRRAFAVVALGLLAEKSELPWNSRYLIDANFTTLLRPLQEVFDIL